MRGGTEKCHTARDLETERLFVEGSIMRTALLVAVVSIISLLGVLAGEHQAVAQTSRGTDKLIEKSGAFETLVNPDCSHCVDEAKRRTGQLRESDRVLAWIRGKYDGGAIPVRFFLAPYRVISDTYGVFVYDPEAGYLRGFEPSLDFRFHGWRNGVMVIRHQDGTLYSALSGKAFDGPRKGDQLKPVPTLATNWGDWIGRYPGTVAYHMFEKYQPVELPREDHADSIATRGLADPRLPAREEVLGVAIEGNARAYPLALLEKSGGVFADTFAGQKVFVLWYPPTRTAAIYAAAVEGAEQTPSVTLTADSQEMSTPFTDRETGSRWDIAGRALSGERKGQTLRWLPSVQCRWFAWAVEYPATEIAGTPVVQPAPKDGRRDPVSQNDTGRKPLEAVIVSAGDVTPDNVAGWTRSGQRAVVVMLDDSVTAAACQTVAARVSGAQLDLYYWIEVARNAGLADAHPRWMASLGMHGDWQQRFPNVRLPVKDEEVAKAYPWVPIGYREAFDAHLARIQQLMQRAAEPYRGMLLNDLQGGPASCGCGNLQCRWAIDYRVPATATALTGHDVAVQFLTKVRKLVPGKEVIPTWMTECEEDDLPLKLRAGVASTGLCGSVPCAANTCPKVFAQQWSPLVADGNSAIALLVLQKELERIGPQYTASHWVPKAVEYVDTIPAQQGGKSLPHERLWLVLQGYDVSAAERAAARAAALQTNPAAILVALTRLDQSYEPRVIPVK